MTRRVLVLCTTAVLCGAAVASAQAHDFTDWRGLWVTRYDYRNGNASTVQQIVDNAASLGVTDLLFQVRGQSDAYYGSQFEPRAESLRRGWDPLAVAVDRAHEHGMRLHAWINTMPLWNGTAPPSTTTAIPHPYHSTDPDYKVYRLDGSTAPLGSGYVIANPISGAWHEQVANVAGDIVSNYDVDGLHLDYVRWLGSTNWSDLPHDDESHALFTQTTGREPVSRNAGTYRQFVRDRITDLVGSVRTAVKAADPDVALSAAVWRDPDVGFNDVLQDYETWMEQGLLDVVIPMIYLSPSNDHLFAPNLANIMSIETNARVAPGLGVYLHDDPEFSVEQIERLVDAGTGGVTMFAYSSFFASGGLGDDRQTAIQAYLDSIPVPLAGDYNGNGLVEQGDLDLVLGNWGADAGDVPATWINDTPSGIIDQGELDTVLAGWGTSSQPLASAAVPEPAAACLVMVAVSTIFVLRRTRS